LATASKRRQATCIPAAIEAPMAGVVRLALMMVPAESEILRPEYEATLKREKSSGRSTTTDILGVMVTWETRYHLISAKIPLDASLNSEWRSRVDSQMMCTYVVVKEERRAYRSVLGAFDEELCSIIQLKWRISIGKDEG